MSHLALNSKPFKRLCIRTKLNSKARTLQDVVSGFVNTPGRVVTWKKSNFIAVPTQFMFPCSILWSLFNYDTDLLKLPFCLQYTAAVFEPSTFKVASDTVYLSSLHCDNVSTSLHHRLVLSSSICRHPDHAVQLKPIYDSSPHVINNFPSCNQCDLLNQQRKIMLIGTILFIPCGLDPH